MMKSVCVILFLITSSLAQDACPALPPTACKVVDRPKGQKKLRCGAYGKAKHPSLVRDACVAATFADCRQFCLSESTCRSFSFSPDQIMAGTCSLYNGSVVAQGFHANNDSVTQFYNRYCYKFNCPRTGCSSQSFNLQVTSKQSKYFKYLVQRIETVLNFTTDVTKATTFVLNQDCQIMTERRIGSSGVSNMTNPDLVNGPLYFYPNATTYQKNFSVPTCSLDTGSFRLSCNYSTAGGSGDESFYSCNNVVSLGSFPGSPPCKDAEGPIALTAFSFGSGSSRRL